MGWPSETLQALRTKGGLGHECWFGLAAIDEIGGRMVDICDSCFDAVQEDAGDIDQATILHIALDLGADIPDHICEQTESDGEVRCDCGCH